MKKIFFFMAMCVISILSATAQTSVWDGSHTTWTNGTGTQSDPFLIENAAQFAQLAYIVNNGIGAGSGKIVGTGQYWKLTTNINLNGSQSFQWTPIGYYVSDADYYSFGGNFDGNGKTISNLFINTTTLRRIGLFGFAEGGSVSNIGVISGSVSSSSSSYQYTGGIIGYATSTTINNCYNTGSVSSSHYTGGIIGYATSTTINNCYNTGSVYSSYYTGGIIGNATSTIINNCYNTGSVSSYYNYNTYGISSSGVTNSYYLVTCGATQGGVSKTEAFMKSAEFVSLLNGYPNTNFAFKQDVEPFVNNGYPILANNGFNMQLLPATNITKTSATLNCLIENGTANIVAKKLKCNGNTINFSASQNSVSATISGLQQGTNYYYVFVAINSDNDSVVILGNFTTLSFNTNSNGANLIENIDDLMLLANLVNNGNAFSGQTFILANDITLPNTPNNILSIGDKNTNRPFSGTFDGNGKRIYNVYIDQPNTPYQGFFGYAKNANLFNVGLVNITASGRNYTGGLAAYAENTYIRDSYVSGGTLFALSYCGGLVGYQTQGTNSIISSCYNTCTVSGNNYVGGLLGYSNQGTVRNSYAAALVTGQGNGVGAIIGGAQDVLNYNCYFNEESTGQPFAIGENNISEKSGEGNMSSDDMRMQAFVNTLNQGLVTPVWKMDDNPPVNNGFPILIWQNSGNVSVQSITTASLITIYPNPTQDKITISLPKDVNSAVFTLYDMQGRRLFEQRISNQNIISVGYLFPGIYLYDVVFNGHRETGKLVKR